MNSINKNKEKLLLTPAAKKVLDEIVNDYRDQIILRAIRYSNSYELNKNEITVANIIDSVKKFDNSQNMDSNKRRSRYQIIFMFIGILYAFVGFGFLLFNAIKFNFSLQEVISFAIGISGLLIALFGLYYDKFAHLFTKNRQEEVIGYKKGNYSIFFVQRWQDFELLLKRKVAQKTGESTANKPFSFLVNSLLQKGIFTKDDGIKLRNIIIYRNNIFHGEYKEDAPIIIKLINDINYLENKLEKGKN